MALSTACVDMGAELRPDLDVLPDLTERAALRLAGDGALARQVRCSVVAASGRFIRTREPWLVARVSMSLVWPVLTVVLRCSGTEYVEYFDTSGILGVPAGLPLALCEVTR